MLGRFGWKAGAATIRAQSADAFAGDIGIATPLVMQPHGDCTAAEADCLALPTGEQERLGVSEAPDPVLDLVTFYSENLGVPQRRDVGDPAVLRGKAAFYDSGCIACHTPKYVTSRDAPTDAHKFQLIWPYSDFLLHDMGEGLADGQRVGEAERKRVAHAAAVGHRPHRDRLGSHAVPARWPCPQSHRGHPLAWRRSADVARRIRRPAVIGAR